MDAPRSPTSYAPVAGTEDFKDVVDRMSNAKPDVIRTHRTLLEERYDLADRPYEGTMMSRGKAIQEGIRVKLPQGMTWKKLGSLSPEQIRAKGAWPQGFAPLPHLNHAEGGMLFPQYHIDEILRQTDRDLTRYDLDYVMPDRFLPEYPPTIFLTTRPFRNNSSTRPTTDEA